MEKALAEELQTEGIKFAEQKRISIYSIDTGKVLGTHIPDFLVGDKLILELKSSSNYSKQDEAQVLSYLNASKYELAILVNFSTEDLFIKRLIYTNDRKQFVSVE